MKCVRCKTRKRFKEEFCKSCYNNMTRTLIDAEKTKIRMFGYPNNTMNNDFVEQALKEIKEEDELKKENSKGEKV